jgi:Immunity protein 58
MSKATAWKVATLLFGLACLLLVYRIVDLGVSRSYSAASAESDSRNLQALKGLVEHEWRGLSEEQVLSRLKAFVASRPPDSIVLKRLPEDASSIYFEGFRFEFHDGKLVKVT